MKPVSNQKQAISVLLQKLSIASLSLEMKKHISYFDIDGESSFLKLLCYLFVMSSNENIDYADKKNQLAELIDEYADVSDCNEPIEKIAKRRLILDKTDSVARLPNLDNTMHAASSITGRTKFGISYLFAKKEISVLGDDHDPDRRVYLGVLPTLKIAKEIIKLFYDYNERKGVTYIGDKQSAVVSVLSEWELFGDAQFRKIDSRRAVLLFHALDICHFQVPLADHSVEFQARDSKDRPAEYSEEEVKLIVNLMRKLRAIYLQNGSIYFHCKAGQGRSSILAEMFSCLNYLPWQVFTDSGELDVLATIHKVHAGVKHNRNVVDDLTPYRLSALLFLINEFIKCEKEGALEFLSDQHINDDFDDYDTAESFTL